MRDEVDDAILQYILERKGVTAKTILKEIFKDEVSKQRYLYRKLETLLDLGFLKTSWLYPEKGASSPKLYFITPSGAHSIGEKMPRDHAKFQRREFRKVDRIKGYLILLAQTNNWYIIEPNEDARAILAGELKKAAVKKYRQAEPDYFYLGLIPHKVAPDMVLYTGEEAYIVIISHPHAGRGACKERIKRYESIIYSFKFLCFPLSENQKTQWLDMLREYDYYHSTQYQSRFSIQDPNTIDEQM